MQTRSIPRTRLLAVLALVLALAACDNVAPAFHDFEGGPQGWEVLVETHGAPVRHRENANFSTLLGPFPGDPAGRPVIGQTFFLSGTQDHVLISFDMAEIDDWDDETFRVWIDGNPVVADRFAHDRADAPPGTLAVAGASGRQNLGYGLATDQIVRYTITYPVTTSRLRIDMGAQLDEGVGDESWGIDNFSIEEVFGGGTTVLEDVTFDLAGTSIEVSGTPLGAGDMQAPIGPGSMTLRLPVDQATGLLADGPVEMLAFSLERHTVQQINIINATITNNGIFELAAARPTGTLTNGTIDWHGPTAGFRTAGSQSCSGGCGMIPPEILGDYDDTLTLDLGDIRLPGVAPGLGRTFVADPTVLATTPQSLTELHLAGTEPVAATGLPALLEDFEDGDTTGWNTSALDRSWPSFTQFLGRFGGSGGAQAVHKTFSLSGQQDHVLIQFDFYEIDSWDGLAGNEYFTAYVDDVLKVQDWFDHEVTEELEQAERVLGGRGVRLGFTAWADSTYRYTLVVPTTATSLKLGFGARLGPGGTGGGGADESWGIDNVRIAEVRLEEGA